ncbi:MAG: GGDEF domain-containing protein [Rhodanobacter sp.]|nr:MAG: GGDEF domain-containing protein [Rhodanobacter sp.]TAL91585.1 MAG: GGDEF domain-containing protein [Rhodanobacter sp.]TAM39086.1 MAG: GGDEF domain-containing protein [Rhodanobacter sp.]TAN27463.1 MAG: GGDEF domain-containing protein [Rhodanobacter sp.]
MQLPSANWQLIDGAAFRRDYANYLAQRMGPMIHALMVVALCAYLLGVVARGFVGAPPAQLVWQLIPALPLLLVILATRQCREPLPLRILALLCVMLLEIGINLTGIGSLPGAPEPLPGLLLPVASSVIWFGRWDFLVAMALCALGPLPLLLHIGNGSQTLQFALYMTIAVSLATVLRTFMARTLLEQFKLEQRLRERAETDGLTGLLLRNRFLDLGRIALRESHRQQRPASVLFLDADHFKRINDEYGHAAGDVALVALAARLHTQGRKGDLIGRIGGEEFAMLLPDVDRDQALIRAEHLRLAVRASHHPGGHLSASIGIATCAPGCYDSIETLLARADQAMRQAKRDGRDRVVTAIMSA